MMEWFNNLSEGWQTAIFAAGVAVGLAVIGGIIKLLKKQKNSSREQKTIHQKGTGHTATMTEGNTTATNVAGRDIHTGIDLESALTTLVEISTKLGRLEKENEQLREKLETKE